MNKSKFLKKSLAALLAILMVAAMIPLSAAADTSAVIGADTETISVTPGQLTRDAEDDDANWTVTLPYDNTEGVASITIRSLRNGGKVKFWDVKDGTPTLVDSNQNSYTFTVKGVTVAESQTATVELRGQDDNAETEPLATYNFTVVKEATSHDTTIKTATYTYGTDKTVTGTVSGKVITFVVPWGEVPEDDVILGATAGYTTKTMAVTMEKPATGFTLDQPTIKDGQGTIQVEAQSGEKETYTVKFEQEPALRSLTIGGVAAEQDANDPMKWSVSLPKSVITGSGSKGIAVKATAGKRINKTYWGASITSAGVTDSDLVPSGGLNIASDYHPTASNVTSKSYKMVLGDMNGNKTKEYTVEVKMVLNNDTTVKEFGATWTRSSDSQAFEENGVVASNGNMTLTLPKGITITDSAPVGVTDLVFKFNGAVKSVVVEGAPAGAVFAAVVNTDNKEFAITPWDHDADSTTPASSYITLKPTQTVLVTAEDDTQRQYTLTVKADSANTTKPAITEAKAEKTITTETRTYTSTPSSKKITFNVPRNDTWASDSGVNDFDGAWNTALSALACPTELASIEVDGKVVEPTGAAFEYKYKGASVTTEFSVSVPADALADDAVAVINGTHGTTDNTKYIIDSTHPLSIVVTAKDKKTTQTYTVTATKVDSGETTATTAVDATGGSNTVSGLTFKTTPHSYVEVYAKEVGCSDFFHATQAKAIAMVINDGTGTAKVIDTYDIVFTADAAKEGTSLLGFTLYDCATEGDVTAENTYDGGTPTSAGVTISKVLPWSLVNSTRDLAVKFTVSNKAKLFLAKADDSIVALADSGWNDDGTAKTTVRASDFAEAKGLVVLSEAGYARNGAADVTTSSTWTSLTGGATYTKYPLKVTTAEASDARDIISIASADNMVSSVIDNAGRTVTLKVPASYVTAGAEEYFDLLVELSPNASIAEVNEGAIETVKVIGNDEGVYTLVGSNNTAVFTDNKITVTAQDGSTRDYTLSVEIGELDDNTGLSSVTVEGVEATVDAENNTIEATLPAETDLTAVEITATAAGIGARVEINAEAVEGKYDVTEPITITVTSQKGSSVTYTLTVKTAGDEPENPFTDIGDPNDPNNWSASSIITASQNGWILGMGNGKFDPKGQMTRAQFALIIARIQAGGNDAWEEIAGDYTTDVYDDVSATNDYMNAIAYVTEEGIMSGKGAGKFDPNGTITRQEAAKVMAVASGLEEIPGNTTYSDDASIAGWAKGYVNAVTENNIMNGMGAGFSPNVKLTREMGATILVRAFDKADEPNEPDEPTE